MAHVDVACHQQLLHRLGELQQTQQVRRSGTRPADRIGGLLVGHAELVDQTLQASCFFERVEILALDVLDQAHCERCLIGNITYQHRDRVEAGQLRRTPAPLAGNDLESLRGNLADEDRLHDALRLIDAASSSMTRGPSGYAAGICPAASG